MLTGALCLRHEIALSALCPRDPLVGCVVKDSPGGETAVCDPRYAPKRPVATLLAFEMVPIVDHPARLKLSS